MQLKKLISFLETIAPPRYQESYDNAKLITGNPEMEIEGVLVCLDSTEAVLEEAITLNCNVVVAHHPIVFKGLKSLTGKTYVERVIIKAIQNNIAIYAIHTNLDNMYLQGVNTKIAEKLELTRTRVLAPRSGLKKLNAYTASSDAPALRSALLEAGAGNVGMFQQLSHYSKGQGNQNQMIDEEVKIEMLFQPDRERSILSALKQQKTSRATPFEITSVDNANMMVGSGMIGQLAEPMSEMPFLRKVAEVMKAPCIRHTQIRRKPIKTVAVCGGAGSFLLPRAIAQGADIFITADFKYHEFFDADKKLIIADIGHYESEQYTIELLYDLISQKFSNFAAYSTKVETNPVRYLC
ncbi:MAG: Nif3-like dinuclear metal center hexameric protein [Saprospiraceae bacterium]